MLSTVYAHNEPIAAIATALAPAALGIIRVSGSESINMLKQVFSRPKALENAEGNTIVHGWIIRRGIAPPSRSAHEPTIEEKVDEVLVAVYRAPKSFTGEEMAEIFCHGGTAVVLAIYGLLLKNGFRSAAKGEFTLRAFLNGKTDLTRAEAVREIIDAKTDVSRSHAAGRLSGTVYHEIERIKERIIHAIASIEVEIEYPEDEQTIAESFNPLEIMAVKADLEQLSATWTAEKIYQDGARLVLCGRTNAGKSSLFNMLLKEDRAIVSDVHGTTRDWLESWTSFAGIPVRLFDTAGLRQTNDTIEQLGVERSRGLADEADAVLYVIDSKNDLSGDDYRFLCTAAKKKLPLVLVFNKCDTLDESLLSARISEPLVFSDSGSDELPESGAKPGCTVPAAGVDYLGGVDDTEYVRKIPRVLVSAKTGMGIKDLITTVKHILLADTIDVPVQAGLGTQRQKNSVDEALFSVRHALDAPQNGFTLDALVQDLEDALCSLGEITGETTPDDILDTLFSGFCVGK